MIRLTLKVVTLISYVPLRKHVIMIPLISIGNVVMPLVLNYRQQTKFSELNSDGKEDKQRYSSSELIFLRNKRTFLFKEAAKGRNVKAVHVLFNLLDIHKELQLNDVQFCGYMKSVTDLTVSQIYKVFDMLDVDCSGTIDFDEFYLLVCILIAGFQGNGDWMALGGHILPALVKDKTEKHFIFRHSRTVFDLLDEDGGGSISADEFENFGFLFNLNGKAIKEIFSEFDVSGDQNLDYSEFKMFAMECIDRQNELEMKVGVRDFIRSNCTIL